MNKPKFNLSSISIIGLSLLLIMFGQAIAYYTISSVMIALNIHLDVLGIVQWLQNMPYYGIVPQALGVLLLCYFLYTRKFALDKTKTKGQFKTVIVAVTLSCLAIFSLFATIPFVRANAIATTNYFLETPLPLHGYYIGSYPSANGSAFIINGSTWNNFNVVSSSACQSLFETAFVSDTSVYIGEGNYWWTDYVTLTDVSNLTVVAAGKDVAIIHANCAGGSTYNGALINIVNTTDTHWEGFTIDGHTELENGGLRGIQITGNSYNNKITRTKIRATNGSAYSIHGQTWAVYNYPTNCPHDNEISFNEAVDIGLNPAGVAGEGNGIALTDTWGNHIVGNWINHTAPTQNGIDLYWNTHNNLIESNQISYCDYGITIEVDSYGGHRNNTIQQNTLDKIGISGLTCAAWASATTITDNHFIDNTIISNGTSTGSGMYIFNAASLSTIKRNHVKDCTFIDFGGAADQHGIKITSNTAIDMKIDGTTFLHCGWNNSLTSCAISFSAGSRLEINDCDFYQCENQNIRLFNDANCTVNDCDFYNVTSTFYAVHVNTGGDGTVITNNRVHGGAGGGFWLHGNADYCFVSNNYVDVDAYGITVYGGQNCSVVGNYVYGASKGVYIYTGSGTTLVQCNYLMGCTDAIDDGGTGSIIANNNLDD